MNDQHAPKALHRCFFALRFDPPTRAYLASIVEELRSHGADVAWVREENLHLTLRFLGEIDDDQLARAMSSSQMPAVGAMHLSAMGLGAFPGLRNAKVIWTGVAAASKDERHRLEALQSHTERIARSLRLQPENRPYRPHVTLGRIRRPGDRLRELVDDITTRECSSPASTIEEIVLIRSRLASGGSVYEEIARWPI
jgi:2'-5' RNA ligase